MRKWLIGLLGGAAVLFAAWYYASPFYAMNNLRDAAESGDPAQLEGSVDFPALREDLKAEFSERSANRIGGDLGRIGARLGMAVADPLIDTLLTPEAIATVVRQGKVLPVRRASAAAPETPAQQQPAWSVERDGLSRFTARPEAAGGTALVFERRGLGWKLVGIDLPES